MSKLFFYGTKLSEFEQMMMLVPNFIPRKKGVIVMQNLTVDENQDSTNYKRLVKSCFSKSSNPCFHKRLEKLMHSFNGEWFLNADHKQRFINMCKADSTKEFLAIGYLLSADEELWSRSLRCGDLNEINLSDISLRDISADGYALYQTARTIATGKEYIHINEIADEQLIGNFLFRIIIHAILIARFGGVAFKIKNKQESEIVACHYLL